MEQENHGRVLSLLVVCRIDSKHLINWEDSYMLIKAFQLIGRVEKVLLATSYGSHISAPAEKVKFIQGQGVLHDHHYGPRLLDVRDSAALRFGLLKGMESFNVRQWSAVSQEELDEIARCMGIKTINHGLLGENMVVVGIPNFSRLPIGTQFFFKGPVGELRSTILFVSGENAPCHIPGNAIQACCQDKPGLKASFVKNAKRRRGLVGFVVGSGFIKEGDKVIAEIPDQEIYKDQT